MKSQNWTSGLALARGCPQLGLVQVKPQPPWEVSAGLRVGNLPLLLWLGAVLSLVHLELQTPRQLRFVARDRAFDWIPGSG